VRRLDAFELVAGRHPDVGEHGVGAQLVHRGEQFVAVADAGQHLYLAGVFKEPVGAFADQVVVLGDNDS
jgi:hypothetical protein